ncbi:MAG: hypothetical protein QHI48_04655 [Bacteroidota bacterium]|nr:hypothetical protein [Bacteroidota bacterium]
MKQQSAIEALINDELTKDLSHFLETRLKNKYGRQWWEKGVYEKLNKATSENEALNRTYPENRREEIRRREGEFDFQLAWTVLRNNQDILQWKSEFSFMQIWNNVREARNRWVHKGTKLPSFKVELQDIDALYTAAQALGLSDDTIHKLKVLQDLRRRTESSYKGPITQEELARELEAVKQRSQNVEQNDTPCTAVVSAESEPSDSPSSQTPSLLEKAQRLFQRLFPFIPPKYGFAVGVLSLVVIAIAAAASFRFLLPSSHENNEGTGIVGTMTMPQPTASVDTPQQNVQLPKPSKLPRTLPRDEEVKSLREESSSVALTRTNLLRLLTGAGDVRRAYPRYARWSEEQVAADLAALSSDRAELRRHVARWKKYIVELQEYSTDRICNTVVSHFGQ